MYDPFETNAQLERQQQPANNHFSDYEQLKLLKQAKSVYLSNDDRFQKLLQAATINQDTEFLAMAQEYLNEKIMQSLTDPHPFESPSAQVSSMPMPDHPILMGKIKREEHRPFLYKKDALNQHILITGGAGTGKTNLLYSLVLQVIFYGLYVLIFDRDKKDFRHLKNFKLGKDIIVLRVKDFFFNFLQVPSNVTPQEWIISFCFIFTHYFDLLAGSEGFLIPIITSLYRDYGIFDGKTTYPSLNDLYDRVKALPVKGYSMRFKDTILNRLESFLALYGPACEVSQGIPIEYIASNNIVFEISELTERASRFFVGVILMALFKHRIASGMIGNIVRNIAVIDECRYLVPPGYNQNLNFSPLTSLLSQSRDAGIGIILSDQSAQLEPAVFVNTRCKLTFRLGNGFDIKKIAQSMSLTREQEAYITSMGVGEAIAKIPQDDPFVIQTLPVNIE